ncbi:MAG TPA: AI-2E family transporter [Chthoniobacteraceae bacterium]|jgi:predicted PurR-regulated permease PerM
MNLSEYPTPWQRKIIWGALTTLAIVAIGGTAVGLIWLVSRVLGFLQPILIPFAIAGVMAYLLHPLVSKIVSWGTSRQRAVLFVFALVSIAFAGILLWIVPAISTQSVNLARRVPGYTLRLKELAVDFAEEVRLKHGIQLLPQLQPGDQAVSPGAPPEDPTIKIMEPEERPLLTGTSLGTPVETDLGTVAPRATVAAAEVDQFDLQHLLSGDWMRTTLPAVLRNGWNLIRQSVGGFLGVFGFLLSMIIVPIYLYYFLIESRNISESWGDYIPLRASAFKDEVVSVLAEINGYLIAFFRGQLLVSLLNGTATGIGLVVVGLDFGLLIGLLLCLLGLIPYLGIILCWIPAVIIAIVQGGAGTWVPSEPWWLFPVIVTGIFAIVQQIDGLFITPKIVGESVGLHPMTVIVSVFVWSLLMGGLLGAILAVPMTATVKVLLKRYVWQRRFMAEPRVVPLGVAIAVPSVSFEPDHLSEK